MSPAATCIYIFLQYTHVGVHSMMICIECRAIDVDSSAIHEVAHFSLKLAASVVLYCVHILTVFSL